MAKAAEAINPKGENHRVSDLWECCIVYRNAGKAGQTHSRNAGKLRRLNLGSVGAGGVGRSLAADPAAITAAMASLAAIPIKPVKLADLDSPRARAERQANRLLGETPITSGTPMIKHPRFNKEKRRR
jgi:hypothetical protein